MRLYLDDDSASALLTRLLRQEGHDVQCPTDVGLSGQDDAVHLTQAAREVRVVLTGNHGDFRNLHNLIVQVKGHHSGILVVRRDNDPTKDLAAAGVVRAIRNLLAANIPVQDQYVILNHWR